jgi:membrane-bound lytic murein transglycosylase D
MPGRFNLIFLTVTVAVLCTFTSARAEYPLPEEMASSSPVKQKSASVPSQLKPPSEDVAQLDEAIDDSLEGKPYNIPMILNDSVENHLEYFKTRGKDMFQLWLDRSARYIPVMKTIFREKNLPEDLVYIAMIESGFNPYAVSWARAVGPWQFMPATGKMYGLKINWWIDERKDPVKSTYAAAEHFKDLHNLFGSWPLAMASYNAGAGKVQRAVLRTRSEDFWDLKASRYIRKETKNYVPKYMAATIIAKNPEAYGFALPKQDLYAYDEVVIEESMDLRLVARCAGSTYEELKELNPELRRWITPPELNKYVLRIPSGKKATFLANYAAVPPEQKVKWERCEVKKGDTLSGLAKQYNTTPEAIRDINGLKKNRVIPGKHVLIPVNINGKAQDLSYMTPQQGGKQQHILYRVRRGETLSKIARRHNVTVADIREWNKGISKSVRAGQKIKLVVDSDSI